MVLEGMQLKRNEFIEWIISAGFFGFYSALALLWSYGMAAHYRLGHIGVILKHCFGIGFIQHEFSSGNQSEISPGCKWKHSKDRWLWGAHQKYSTDPPQNPMQMHQQTSQLPTSLYYLIISAGHKSSTRYINHQVSHLLNPKGFPAYSEESVSPC